MKSGKGKQKILIKKIDNPQSRAVCFSKRRNGLFKKAKELSALSGAQVAICVQSQTGKFFVDGSPSADSVIHQFLQRNMPYERSSVDQKSMSSLIERKETELESTNKDELEPWRFWMDLNVDSLSSVEEVTLLIEKLEDVKSKVTSRIAVRELEFVESLFA